MENQRNLKMRRIFCLLGIITYLYACAAYSDTKPVGSHPQGRITLDQSQDVYFEQFSPNTFSQQLLQAKSKFNKDDLIFGGSLQADLQHWQGNQIQETSIGPYQQGNGFFLTQGTADLMVNFSRWGTGFVSIADSHIGRPGPNGNFLYFSHAFIVFGNLDIFPVYATVGINTIPFGVFTGSGPWDTPLTADYFNPSQAPQVGVAFYKNGWNASVTGFSESGNHKNNFAYSVYYNYSSDNLSYSLGLGYLTDLNSSSTSAVNNGARPVAANINRRANILNLPNGSDLGEIFDINGSINYGLFELTAEFDFGQQIIQGNNGRPKAYALALTYTPSIFGKDTTFGIGHSDSYSLSGVPAPLSGADAIGLADFGLQSTWALGVSRPLTTDSIVLGLELEKQTTYSNEKTYTSTLDLVMYL